MPLIAKEKVSPYTEYFVWHITEPIDYFLTQLTLDDFEQAYLDKLIAKKQTEFLAGRFLLDHALNRAERTFLTISPSGKPFLEDGSMEISLSHSAKYVAVVLSDRLVGIDIQQETPQLDRIKRKFIAEDEFERFNSVMNSNVVYHFWSAKEALFKAYGNGKVEFRTDLKIDQLPQDISHGTGLGRVIKPDLQADFNIFARQIEDYHLVVAEIKKE